MELTPRSSTEASDGFTSTGANSDRDVGCMRGSSPRYPIPVAGDAGLSTHILPHAHLRLRDPGQEGRGDRKDLRDCAVDQGCGVEEAPGDGRAGASRAAGPDDRGELVRPEG